MTRPIAITGLGAVTPLGVGADTLIDRWMAGEVGIADGLAACDDFDPRETMSVKEARRAHRFAQLMVASATEAAVQAGWDDDLPCDPYRVGVVIGTGVGGGTTHEAQQDILRERGPDKVSALTVTELMPAGPSAMLTKRFGIRGYASAVGTACAAGADAICLGVRLIESGELDAILVGGSESCMSELVITAFTGIGALSQCGISRPFDRNRDGFVLGEGAGALTLEAADVAAARGAEVLGTIRGAGMSSDGYHMTAPHPEGTHAAHALRTALERGGIEPSDIDYVNAHGTSTTLNDPVETRLLKTVLGDAARRVPISSTKSVIGHTIGAAGAIDAVATTLALHRRSAPPTVGLAEPDPDCDLDYVPDRPRPLGSDGSGPLIGITNSFGFGGHNTVLAIEAG